jgi:hypothetical protein
MAQSVLVRHAEARFHLIPKLVAVALCVTALVVVSNTWDVQDEASEVVRQAPIGTAGNEFDDGDQDADDYEYDPLFGDDVEGHPEDSLPDVEGQAPPTPKWHACRFQAKTGGVFDLRPLMRLARTLEEDWVHRDAVHRNSSYYLNVCANTMAVPPACRKLAKHDKSPAYQVADNGDCYYLGTLKTFKWKPIDPKIPSKVHHHHYLH